jgi:hypothetical protein
MANIHQKETNERFLNNKYCPNRKAFISLHFSFSFWAAQAFPSLFTSLAGSHALQHFFFF